MTGIRMSKWAAAACAAALWNSPVMADGVPGAMPGDEAMTCQQIAAELAPYAQQMMPAAAALNQTQGELLAHSQRRMSEAMPEVAGLTAAATAAHADPTGLASRGVVAAEQSLQQREWNRALAEDKPLHDQMTAQTNAVVAQGMSIQSNPRVQRLMQLAQQKNCH
jgi:hypothetical protein